MKILIAAGGTGGHIYPGLATGCALKRLYPDATVDYVCGQRDLEQRIYKDNGVQPIVLPARQLSGGALGKFLGGFAALCNVLRCVVLIRKNGYDAVVGFGGYVSGPAVFAGYLARRRTVVHEANSIVGKANSLLAPYVDCFASHMEVPAGILKTKRLVRVGMPVRPEVFQGSREQAIEKYSLDATRRTLLVSAGSQGAKYLYQTLLQSIPLLDTPAHGDVQVLWSTGLGNIDQIRNGLRDLELKHIKVVPVPFLDMSLALAVADAAFTRAGASTIAEQVGCGLRGIYVPLPTAIYDHQTINARIVQKAGMGTAIPEQELTAGRAAEAIAALLSQTRRGERCTVPAEIDSRLAAEKLARLIAEPS